MKWHPSSSGHVMLTFVATMSPCTTWPMNAADGISPFGPFF